MRILGVLYGAGRYRSAIAWSKKRSTMRILGVLYGAGRSVF